MSFYLNDKSLNETLIFFLNKFFNFWEKNHLSFHLSLLQLKFQDEVDRNDRSFRTIIETTLEVHSNPRPLRHLDDGLCETVTVTYSFISYLVYGRTVPDRCNRKTQTTYVIIKYCLEGNLALRPLSSNTGDSNTQPGLFEFETPDLMLLECDVTCGRIVQKQVFSFQNQLLLLNMFFLK